MSDPLFLGLAAGLIQSAFKYAASKKAPESKPKPKEEKEEGNWLAELADVRPKAGTPKNPSLTAAAVALLSTMACGVERATSAENTCQYGTKPTIKGSPTYDESSTENGVAYMAQYDEESGQYVGGTEVLWRLPNEIRNCDSTSDGMTFVWNFGDGSEPVETTDREVSHIFVNNSTGVTVEVISKNGESVVVEAKILPWIDNRSCGVLFLSEIIAYFAPASEGEEPTLVHNPWQDIFVGDEILFRVEAESYGIENPDDLILYCKTDGKINSDWERVPGVADEATSTIDFSYRHTFDEENTQIGERTVRCRIIDTTLSEPVVPSGTIEEMYPAEYPSGIDVCSLDKSIKINVNEISTSAGIDLSQIEIWPQGKTEARREVKVIAPNVPDDVDIAWEITGPNVTDVVPNGMEATFKPMEEGWYRATLILSGGLLNEPVPVSPVSGRFYVSPFSLPQVTIDGPTAASPSAGYNFVYHVHFTANEVDRPEDLAARCDWQVYYTNSDPLPNQNPSVIYPGYEFQNPDNPEDLPLCSEGLEVNFPSDRLNKTDFRIQVKIYGDEGSYETDVIESDRIEVYPMSTGPIEPSTTDFDWTPPYGGKVGDVFTFSAHNLPEDASFSWEIVRRDITLFDPPIPMGNENPQTYVFDEAGTHTIRFIARDINTLAVLAEIEKDIEVYPAQASVCYEDPHHGAPVMDPFASNMPRGANTYYTWTVPNVADCYGNPIEEFAYDLDSYLYDYSFNYDEDTRTLIVTGRVLPAVYGGTIPITSVDVSGLPDTIELPVPYPVDPKVVVTDDNNYVQVSEEISLSLDTPVSGATYKYKISMYDNPLTESLSLSSPYWNYVPTQPGLYTAVAEITTEFGSTYSVQETFSVEGEGAAGVCYSIPQPGTYDLTPDISEMAKGGNITFIWTYNDLDDCFGEDLIPVSDNLNEVLYNPTINYNGGTLTVTGQILPTVDGGSTIKFDFVDSYGNPKSINLYLPEIKPLKIETPDFSIQQNEEVTFSLAQEVIGATNYHFVVTRPDDTTETFDQISPNFTYTPTQTGPHTLNLEVTAYNGDIIPASYDFFVYEATGAPTCFSIPEPGSYNRIPDISEMPKGADILFSWTYNDLTDCFGEPLTPVSDNVNEMLNNPTLNYNGGNLTVTGQILPGVDGGTIKLTFEDSYGNPVVINLYLPELKPLKIKTSDDHIQQNENVAFFLEEEVSGATNYQFVVTRPDDTQQTFNQPSSSFSYTPTQLGPYHIDLYVTTYSGEVVSTSYSFGVHDPTGGAACYIVPDPGAYNRTPNISHMPQGADILFTWTYNDLTDCLGNPLTLISDNLNEMLYNSSINYNGNTLTVAGQILPSVDGGTIKVTFEDSFGNPKVVSLYLPQIDPLEIETPDSHIQQNEQVDFYLLTAVPGATNYQFIVNKPDDTQEIFNQLSTTFTYTPNQQGSYTLDLNVTTYSGEIVPASYGFFVNE